MIFIGTMEWASTRLRGMFACPNCGTTEAFRLRASRPFLTLYFIPVIPLGALQEHVQCGTCKHSFETVVLSNHLLPSKPAITSLPEEEIPFQEDLIRVIALMMIEDGHVTENEIKIARRLFENITEQAVSREDLGRMCSQLRLHHLNTASFLATAVDRRSHEEKLLMVQAMFGVAGADGEISPGRLESLLKTQKVMGLADSEFQLAIAATSQWLS